MAIFKYKQPIILLPNGGGGEIKYEKWVINLKTWTNILQKCEEILLIYNKFLNFYYLPITISFSKVIPKSDRIKHIFKKANTKPIQIGANYVFNPKNELSKINLVYVCTMQDIYKTIYAIKSVIKLLTPEVAFTINEINSQKEKNSIKKEKIKSYLKQYKELWKWKNVINDLIYIEDVNIIFAETYTYSPIISIYEIIDFGVFKNMLAKEGIEIDETEIVADEFLNLNIDDLNKIITKYPFIISQAVENIEISFDQITDVQNESVYIPKAQNSIQNKRPKIGVIDSKAVLTNNWLTYHENGESFVPSSFKADVYHSTAVSSLIIGRDYLNNYFSDQLGEFKVKSFEVMPKGSINIFYLMKITENIIIQNRDIKIWNLSLGALRTSLKLSVFGKLIDKLQYKYCVQFITASGNDGPNNLATPADSLSAITVGSVYETQEKTLKVSSYTGTGKVFGIYEKPLTYEIGIDLTAHDSSGNYLKMLGPNGEALIKQGTSFSAPLVARKVAYLVEKCSISLELAKAIINYLSKISPYGIADLSLLNNDDIFIFIEGKISSGKIKEIPIILPYDVEKGISEFTAGYSVSYNVANTKNLGDEYSCIDISLRLMKKELVKGKLETTNVVNPDKTNKDAKIEGKNADEIELRKLFGKYDPNAVVIDKDFDKLKGVKLKNLQSFVLRARRIDLFDHISDSINYAAIIHLKETKAKSLSNFAKLNSKNIIKEVSLLDINIDAIEENL